MKPQSSLGPRLKPDSHEGWQPPPLGPSDSSDSASDLPSIMASTQSDAGGAGERAGVAPYERQEDDDGADISPDHIVEEDQASLAHTTPDLRRNGG